MYTFTQGIIKKDTYKKPSHEKDSPYTINFNEHSRIQMAFDDGSISGIHESYMKIADIPNCNPGSELDIVGILK